MKQIYKIIDFIKNKNKDILKMPFKFCDGFKIIDIRKEKRYTNINYFFALINCNSHYDGYLGKTKCSIEDRIYQHLWDVKNQRENSRFHSMIRKYGPEKFICFIFDDYKTDKSCYLNEERNIKICKNNNIRLANLTNGNEGSKGFAAGPATRLKLSEKMKGRNLWWKDKISKSLKGYKQTEKHRINNALGGLKKQFKNKQEAKNFITEANKYVKKGLGWVSMSNIFNKQKYFGMYMCKNSYLNLYMWTCWKYHIKPIKNWKVKNKILNNYFQ